MKIKTITNQHRRDFTAIYECEHCGHTEKGYGYDDDNFHRNVIPKMTCTKCGEAAPADYRPAGTRYGADAAVIILKGAAKHGHLH